jgi:hypothetical protein
MRVNEQFAGRVLATGEMNYHDDSDFYAVVLDFDGRIRRVDDGTTRFAAPPSARVDATPEIQAEAEVALADYFFRQMQNAAGARATKITIGKRVKAVRGRKVAIGAEGTVFWLGWNDFQTRYANSYSAKREGNEDRVGIKLDDGTKVFAAKANFEVVEPGDEMPSEAEIRTQADRAAKSRSWRSVGALPAMAFV